MSFFNFIEQDHTIGTAANRFGQLTALFVAYVSWRRSKQTRHGVLFVILGHIQPHHGFFVAEHEISQRFRQFGFTYARRTNKDKRTNRPARIFQTRPRATDGVGDGLDGLALADDAFTQAFFHVQQTFGFRLHHLADGDAGPLGDHFGDIVHVNHFVQFMFGFPLIALGEEFVFQAQPVGFLSGSAFVITFHTRLLLFRFELFQFAFHLLEVAGQ